MPEQKNKKENVIWIFGDQHRAQALGVNGDPNLHTPNLDLMAAQGVNCTNAVAGMPLCCPFRGSLLTSLYPHECVPGHEYPLDPKLPTIATAFREHGYHTAYLGKWHLDGWKEREGRAAMHIVPPERRGGFDDWLGFDNNNSQWDSWVHGKVPGWTERCPSPTETECHYRLPGYETDALTDLLIDYICHAGEKNTDGGDFPFFAVLSVQPPHDPFIAPPEFMEKHTPAGVILRDNVPNVARVTHEARQGLAGYYAQIENLDWNVGRIRNALSQAGLGENTHILFFSDHGEMLGCHGQFRKMSPLEESIRIPFIMGGGYEMDKYNAKCQYESDVVINHVDIAPTTLGICGLPVPAWMHGTDYSACRKRKDAPEYPDSAFIQSVVPTMHGNSIDRPWRGVVTRDGWKYVCLEGQPWMLFNLNEDPFEQINLAHNVVFAKKRKSLHDRLERWIRETGDSFNLPAV